MSKNKSVTKENGKSDNALWNAHDMVSLWKNEFLQELFPYLNLASTKGLTGRATSTVRGAEGYLISDGDFILTERQERGEGRREDTDYL